MTVVVFCFSRRDRFDDPRFPSSTPAFDDRNRYGRNEREGFRPPDRDPRDPREIRDARDPRDQGDRREPDRREPVPFERYGSGRGDSRFPDGNFITRSFIYLF